MKVKKLYLIIALLLSVLLVGGCANKAEKLTELQQSQLQLQQQVQIKEVEAAEVMKSAQKYNRLTNKYQNLVRKQIDVVNGLKKSYDELGDSNTKEEVIIENKLIKATQDSVKLQRKLKRYSQKAMLNVKKAEKLEKKVQVEEKETVNNTEKQIVKIKQEQRVKVESNNE